MPVLSIITPVKNAASWIEACVASVQQQEATQWEWIFINDHSSDNTIELLNTLAQKDRRIHLHQNPGQGILPAIQYGLQQAKGTYITRMDADDLMPPHRLQYMLNAIENAPPKTVITGKVRYFSEHSISTGYQAYEQWLNHLTAHNSHWQHLYRECVVASPNWMMRTDELRAIHGFDDLGYPEDYDLCFRWYAHGFSIQTLQQTTLLWREHPQRTSRKSTNYQQAAFFTLKIKRFIQLEYTPQQPLVLLGTGKKARLSADVLLRLEVSFHWIGMNPSKAKLGEKTIAIQPLTFLAQLNKPLVLLSIYPAKAEREKLEAHLHTLNLHLARDYWYL